MNFKKVVICVALLIVTCFTSGFNFMQLINPPLEKYKTLSPTRDNPGIWAIGWSQDSKRIAASHNFANEIVVWNVETGELIQNLVNTGGSEYNVNFLPDSNFLLTGASGIPPMSARERLTTFSIWDITKAQVTQNIPGPFPQDISDPHRNVVHLFAVSKDGRFAIYQNIDGDDVAIYSFDFKRFIYINNSIGAERPSSGLASSIAISPDGKYFAIGHGLGVISIFNTNTGQLLKSIKIYKRTQIAIGALAFSPDSKFLASGAGMGGIELPPDMPAYKWPDHVVNIWKVEDGSLVSSYPIDAARMTRTISWSPDGKYVAFTGTDGAVRLWTPHDPQKPSIKIDFSVSPINAQISPNGKYLAVATGSDVKIFMMPN